MTNEELLEAIKQGVCDALNKVDIADAIRQGVFDALVVGDSLIANAIADGTREALG